MSTYAIIYIVLLAISGGISLAKHGDSRGPYSFWEWVFGCVIVCYLLYMGGFFNKV